MFFGATQVVHGTLTTGGYVTYVMFLAFMIAPIAQLVSIGPKLTAALAGPDAPADTHNASQEAAEPARTVTLATIRGDIRFDDVRFSYEPEKEVLHGITFESLPGSV